MVDLDFMRFHHPRRNFEAYPFPWDTPIFQFILGKGGANGAEMIIWNHFQLLVFHEKKLY